MHSSEGQKEQKRGAEERKGAIEMLHAKSLLESLGSVPGADEFRLQLQ
jgi:hypothetical protein